MEMAHVSECSLIQTATGPHRVQVYIVGRLAMLFNMVFKLSAYLIHGDPNFSCQVGIFPVNTRLLLIAQSMNRANS